jgi:hypothetical protein
LTDLENLYWCSDFISSQQKMTMSTPTKSTQPTRRSPRGHPQPRRSPRIEELMKARQDVIKSPRTREITALLLSPQPSLIGGYLTPPSSSLMTSTKQSSSPKVQFQDTVTQGFNSADPPNSVRRLVVEKNGFETPERRVRTCEYVAVVGEIMIVAIGGCVIAVSALLLVPFLM